MLLLRVSSTSPLLHASLAHLSPEVLAMNDIIESPGRRSRLPTELMLIVHDHLKTELSADLAKHSDDALASYAHSLVSLLCGECASYNTDIYGVNVFDWPLDQFSGPCLCSGDIDDCLSRTRSFTDNIAKLQCDLIERRSLYLFKPINLSRTKSGEVISKCDLLQFSHQLLDPQFFLELFLSRQARRFARHAYKEVRKAASGGGKRPERVESLLKVRSIWDAVDLVLCEQYQSEVIPKRTSCIPAFAMVAGSAWKSITLRPTKTVPRQIHADSKSQSEGGEDPEIVDLSGSDFEALSPCNSSALPSTIDPSPLGLMSGNYRRKRDPIYISLIRNQACSAELQDCEVTHSLLLRTKHSLGLSNLLPPSPSPSASFPDHSGTPVSRDGVDGPRSPNPDEDRSHDLLNCGSDDDDVVDSTSPRLPIHYPSVPSTTPATKPHPVLVAPTTGITSTTSDTQEGALPGTQFAGEVATRTTGVRVGHRNHAIGATMRSSTVVVGAPGAEAKPEVEAQRQINEPWNLAVEGSTATTSSAMSPSSWDSATSSPLDWNLADTSLFPHQITEPLARILSALRLVPRLASAVFCIPLTLASLAVTVLCFYARPRSFRIL